MDVVIDSCVMRLYDTPGDPKLQFLFKWLYDTGTLCLSRPLLNEYNRHGNPLIASLLLYLGAQDRLAHIPNSVLKEFDLDKGYKYLCNKADIPHARLTFVSKRKRLVSFDDKLRESVSKFKKVNGIKPSATKSPDAKFLI